MMQAVLRYVGMLLAAALVVLRPFPAWPAKALLVVFDDYPPYHYWDGETPAGLNVELTREAFRRMAEPIRFERRSWRRSLHDVATGDVDCVVAGFRTPEREAFAFYPDEPLSLETNAVIFRADDANPIRHLNDLYTRTVGVVAAYKYGESFDTMPHLKKQESASDSLLLSKLLEHRVDAIMGSRLVIRHLAMKREALDRIAIGPLLKGEPLYLLISRRLGPRGSTLARRFGETLRQMRRDGTTAKFKARY
ncbi:substrate-binding periplasmic protein [Pseudodesulfovibrio tunisiensis]|uniref:substrate-binding periplasmic protein n=1 Tax=Pseudodesulfovibrio tunisiensis TaxID=463192 RepID=UPI001FB54A81|nr:transporter substrate-binding domain-containing protein [Pseudodesulfovibrio tunisiensis]